MAIGASAGGVEALSQLVGDLPAGLRAAVLVVLHVVPVETSVLPSILSRAGSMPAAHAHDGEALAEGRIHVAPPDRHLLVRDGRLLLRRGPRENLVRPAIDPLFRSAAVAYGPRAVAVVLTGTRSDGAAGAAAVSERGGTVLVQDPAEAGFPSMPLNAIAQDHPDLVLPVREMAAAIVDLVDRLPEEAEMSDNGHDEMSLEASYAALDAAAVEREDAPGELTPYSCPECWGALWESSENGVPRYRCRVGHAFAADSVVEKQSDSIDQALWMALRALLERAQLTERIAARIRSTNGSEKTAARFDSQSQEAHTQAAVIRRVLLERDASPETP